MYHRERKQPHILSSGRGVIPAFIKLDERRRVWHFAMLFFDAYTLEGNFRVFTIEKERFL